MNGNQLYKEISISKDSRQLAIKVCQFIKECSESKLTESEVFTIGFSGGSMPVLLKEGLDILKLADTSKWIVFFCDERIVSFDDDESIFKQYRDNILSAVGVLPNNILTIDPSLVPDKCAVDYQGRIEAALDGHSPDLLLLGVGPDGHTASLFPGHSLLEVRDKLVAAIEDSPKPPPCRVTMTYSLINSAKQVAFITTGVAKSQVVKDCVYNEHSLLPVALVCKRQCRWFIDELAASML